MRNRGVREFSTLTSQQPSTVRLFQLTDRPVKALRVNGHFVWCCSFPPSIFSLPSHLSHDCCGDSGSKRVLQSLYILIDDMIIIALIDQLGNNYINWGINQLRGLKQGLAHRRGAYAYIKGYAAWRGSTVSCGEYCRSFNNTITRMPCSISF